MDKAIAELGRGKLYRFVTEDGATKRKRNIKMKEAEAQFDGRRSGRKMLRWRKRYCNVMERKEVAECEGGQSVAECEVEALAEYF